MSVFRYSAWEWNEERGQFYYHAFAVAQPDLNYRNPALVEEMKVCTSFVVQLSMPTSIIFQNVLRFWLGQGADGFRMDAVPYLFEDQQFLDEPLSGKPTQDDQVR